MPEWLWLWCSSSPWGERSGAHLDHHTILPLPAVPCARLSPPPAPLRPAPQLVVPALWPGGPPLVQGPPDSVPHQRQRLLRPAARPGRHIPRVGRQAPSGGGLKQSTWQQRFPRRAPWMHVAHTSPCRRWSEAPESGPLQRPQLRICAPYERICAPYERICGGLSTRPQLCAASCGNDWHAVAASRLGSKFRHTPAMMQSVLPCRPPTQRSFSPAAAPPVFDAAP